MVSSKGNFLSALMGGLVVAIVMASLPAVAANGDPMLVGQKNIATQITQLVGKGGFRIINTRLGIPALRLVVADPAAAPFSVNATGLVDNLNADLLDGMHASELAVSNIDCEKCDLEGAHFALAFLAGANLTSAELPLTTLTGANLSYASLVQADMTNADARYANLDHASLANATLLQADLYGATLTDAVLVGTDLSGADLSHANMTGATGTPFVDGLTVWAGTICPDGSNTDTNGAGTCVGHWLP